MQTRRSACRSSAIIRSWGVGSAGYVQPSRPQLHRFLLPGGVGAVHPRHPGTEPPAHGPPRAPARTRSPAPCAHQDQRHDRRPSPSDPPSQTTTNKHTSPAGASDTDDSDGRAHGGSPVSRGRHPRQTNHGLTSTKGKRGVSGQPPNDHSFHPPAYARPAARASDFLCRRFTRVGGRRSGS